jgi:pilus assembly protein Flp/PilA
MKVLNWFLCYTKSKIKDEKGQGMVEYGLIIALIALVVIGALVAMGDSLTAKFNEIVTKLSGAGT